MRTKQYKRIKGEKKNFPGKAEVKGCWRSQKSWWQKKKGKKKERDSNEVGSSLCAPFLSPTQMAIWQHIPSFIGLLTISYILSIDLGTKNYRVTSTDAISALMGFAV